MNVFASVSIVQDVRSAGCVGKMSNRSPRRVSKSPLKSEAQRKKRKLSDIEKKESPVCTK